MVEEKMVRVRVPGTTANCGPGFDAIGIACNIYNELELTLKPEGELVITVAGEGAANIPGDSRNIVWRSVQHLLRKARINCQGAHIKMQNNVPLSRGLGSSAAAIVAGLKAANEAIGGRFNNDELLAMATEIEGHPDNVAPAIFGGVTISVVQEDGQPACLSFIPEIPLKLIVAVPEFSLSTRSARSVLPQTVPFHDAVFNVSRASLLVAALCRGETRLLRQAFDDALHQPYRAALIPGMYEVFKAARAAGALGAALSGAGPCLIAFATKNADQIGEAMTAAFAKEQVKSRYLVLNIDSQGAQVL